MKTVIPLRYQAECHFCGEIVDTRRSAGNWQLKSGWARSRSEGGTNALALPQALNQYAHNMCVDNEKHHNVVQYTLFG